MSTDLYRAGVVLYELVAGQRPFNGPDADVLQRVLLERPVDPSVHDARISWELDWVLQKALAKEASERFATATEMLEAVKRGLEESVGRTLEPPPAPKKPEAIAANAGSEAAAAQPGSATRAAAAKAANAPRSPSTPAKNAAATAPPKSSAAQAKSVAGAPAAQPRSPAAQPKPAAPAAPSKAEPPASPAPATPPQAAAGKLAGKARLLAPKESKPAAAPVPTKPRVLFVDDEERILSALRAVFRDDYHVFTAESGELALELVKRFNIAVVVSDNQMPGMSGVEFLRRVRQANPCSVRMLLTGYSDMQAIAGSINEGEVFRFLRKPWEHAQLKAALADAVAAAARLEAPRAAPAQPSRPVAQGNVLVIDPQAGLASGLEVLLRGAATVTRVPSAVDAVKRLSDEVSVIVADLAAGRDGLLVLFKLLKAERPDVPSILVTDAPDSDLVVDLINQAHVFRFLGKPVDARRLIEHIDAAFEKGRLLREGPKAKPAAADSAGVAGRHDDLRARGPVPRGA